MIFIGDANITSTNLADIVINHRSPLVRPGFQFLASCFKREGGWAGEWVGEEHVLIIRASHPL
jgi:hypothetical protein